jgi:hypothetical protein
MPKTKISEFSATPGNNTDIDGINIAEGCAPSGINDAIRELMAQLKDFQAGTAGDSFNGPVGTSTAAAGAFTTLTTSSTVTHNGGTANGVAYLNGSKVLTTGSALTFDGTNFKTTGSVLAGGAVPSSGAGVTLAYNGSTIGYIYAYDWGASTYKTLNVAGGTVDISAANNTQVSFGVNGSEQARLTSTGLGIGTSSPNYSLTSYKGGAVANYLQVASGATGAGSGNGLLLGVDASGNSVINAQGGGINLYTYVAGLLRTTIDSSGNLGIGTSSPVSALGFGETPSSTGITFQSTNTTFNSGKAAVIKASITGSGNGSMVFETYAGGSGGGERMRLDASGNLGLGVTPSAWSGGKWMQFVSTTAVGQQGNGTANLMCNAYESSGNNFSYIASVGAARYNVQAGTHAWFTAPSGTAGNAISFTQAMTLDASGNLLVGTTTQPVGAVTTKLAVVQSTADYSTVINNTNASPYGLYIKHNTDSNGSGNPFIVAVGNATTRFAVRSDGGIENYSANNVNLSDRREKTNFAPAKSYLDTICAIPVQTFNYIDQAEDDPGLTLGVVAQDVQAVAPELVMESNWGTEDNPKMRLSIYQTDLQYALMKCIQEQQALINDLRARVAALESNP